MAFDPNFALYPQRRTSVPALEGRVDGFPSEVHRQSLGTTENPVESGADLTDNAVKRRERVRLEGWVSDLVPAPGNTFSPQRPADTWAAIIELMDDRMPITVVTAIRTYSNMLIEKAEAPRSGRTGGSLRFTIDLAEVQFADTEITRLSADKVAPASPAVERLSQLDLGDKGSTIVRGLEDDGAINIDGTLAFVDEPSVPGIAARGSPVTVATETVTAVTTRARAARADLRNRIDQARGRLSRVRSLGDRARSTAGRVGSSLGRFGL